MLAVTGFEAVYVYPERVEPPGVGQEPVMWFE